MDIRSEVRSFINENFLFNNDADTLEDNQPFLASGIIDSTGVLELVAFVEETFNITIQDHELIPENLDSVENLVHFIQRKKFE